jgi:hypothetical protein
MRVSGEVVAMALNATDWHRSQIQTFCYPLPDGNQMHVVRDLTKPADEQTLWKEIAMQPDHDAAYARKMLEKERAEAFVIADRINALMGTA